MERESRVQLGCALATCLGMLVALCGVALVLIFGLNVASRTVAVSGPATPTSAVNRLALIGADGNVYVSDRNGGSKVAITSDAALSQTATVQRAYVFPNWSPDSQQVAYVGISSEGNGKAALYTARTGDPKSVEIFSTGDALPFYLYWSPDSKRVAFLIQARNNDLTLNFANADGSGSTEAGKGSPFYFSWAPDSQSVMSHVGGSRRQSADAFIGVHSTAGQGTPQNLALAPANFLAPAWSPDGTEVLSAETSGTTSDELTVTDGHGEHPLSIARYTGSVYFNWSPDGKSIAYLLAAGGTAKSELHVARADGSDNQVVTDDSPLAFFWSPDGSKLAYLVRASNGQSSLPFASTNHGAADLTAAALPWARLEASSRLAAGLTPAALPWARLEASSRLATGFTPAALPSARLEAPPQGTRGRPSLQAAPQRLTWKIVSLADKKILTLVSFLPTDTFASIIAYFDQYAQSLRLWSPDSTALVYSIVESDGSDAVYVVNSDGGAEPKRVSDGASAAWSWR